MVILKKDTARKLPVLLADSSGAVETGVVEGSVTVVTSKNGAALAGFTLTDKWTELGQGLYTIDFAAGDLNTEGFFAYLVTVAGCDQYSGIMYVSDWETNVDSILEDTGATLDGKINTIDTVVDAIKGKTDALPTDPADQSLLEAAITTAEGNIRGTDSDTLKTLSEQVDECQAELDTLPPDPADESSLEAAIATAESNIRGADSDDLKVLSDRLDSMALEATLTAIKGAGWTAENLTTIDSLIDDIKAKTDNLPVDPADQSELEALIATAQAQIDVNGVDINGALTNQTVMNATLDANAAALVICQADLDTPDQYKADVSALALEASIATAQAALDYLQQKESGRWKIENDQLTYYKADGTTVLKRFNLFDKDGNPTNLHPTERVPV